MMEECASFSKICGVEGCIKRRENSSAPHYTAPFMVNHALQSRPRPLSPAPLPPPSAAHLAGGGEAVDLLWCEELVDVGRVEHGAHDVLEHLWEHRVREG